MPVSASAASAKDWIIESDLRRDEGAMAVPAIDPDARDGAQHEGWESGSAKPTTPSSTAEPVSR